jgi:hypothetical protein
MRREMKAPLLMGLLDWFCYNTRKEIQSIKVLEQILPSCEFSWSLNRKDSARQGD